MKVSSPNKEDLGGRNVDISSDIRTRNLLIGTVFNEVILSKTVDVALHEVELGVIVACSSLKLCERGGDRSCRSGGGITSAVALKLKNGISIDGMLLSYRSERRRESSDSQY